MGKRLARRRAERDPVEKRDEVHGSEHSTNRSPDAKDDVKEVVAVGAVY